MADVFHLVYGHCVLRTNHLSEEPIVPLNHVPLGKADLEWYPIAFSGFKNDHREKSTARLLQIYSLLYICSQSILFQYLSLWQKDFWT